MHRGEGEGRGGEGRGGEGRGGGEWRRGERGKDYGQHYVGLCAEVLLFPV